MASRGLDPKKIYRSDRTANRDYVDVAIDFYRDVYNEWDFGPIPRSASCSSAVEMSATGCVTDLDPRAR